MLINRFKSIGLLGRPLGLLELYHGLHQSDLLLPGHHLGLHGLYHGIHQSDLLLLGQRTLHYAATSRIGLIFTFA